MNKEILLNLMGGNPLTDMTASKAGQVSRRDIPIVGFLFEDKDNDIAIVWNGRVRYFSNKQMQSLMIPETKTKKSKSLHPKRVGLFEVKS